MNHLNLEEQGRVREHPEDFSVRTRNDVAAQRDHRLPTTRVTWACAPEVLDWQLYKTRAARASFNQDWRSCVNPSAAWKEG